MGKVGKMMGVATLVGAAVVFSGAAWAAPFEIGSTGTRGWGIDFNPSTGKTVYVFPGKKQIIADPVTNTKTVTRRTGTEIVTEYPEGSRLGGPSMGLARFFYNRSL